MANLGEIFQQCPDGFTRYDQNSSLITFSNTTWNIRSWGRFSTNSNSYFEFYVKDASAVRFITLTENSCGIQYIELNGETIDINYYSNFNNITTSPKPTNAYDTLCAEINLTKQYNRIKVYTTDTKQFNFSYIDIVEGGSLISEEDYINETNVYFLLKVNGVYKSYNNDTNTLDNVDAVSNLKARELTGVGIDLLPNAISLLPDLSQTKLIISNNANNVTISATKSNLEMLVMRTDAYTTQVEHINSILSNTKTSGSSVIKFVLSTDSGLTWKTIKDNEWINMSIIIPQNQYSKLSVEDKILWDTAKNTIYIDGIDSTIFNTLDLNELSFDKLRFAIVLGNDNCEDECVIENIKYNVTMKDYMQLCTESEVECMIVGNAIKAKSNISTNKLIFNISTAGITNGEAFNYDEADNKPILNNKTLEGNMSFDDIGIASKESVKTLSDRIDMLSGDTQNYKGYYAIESDRDTVITDPKEGDYCVIGASTSEDVMYKNKTIKYFYTNGEWKVFNVLPTGSVNIDDTSTDATDKVWSIKKVSEELEKKKTDNGTYSISIDSSQLVLDEDVESEYKGFYKVTITHQLKCFQKFNLCVTTASGRSCNMCVFYDNIQENSFDLYSLSNTSILVEVEAY